MTWQPVASLRIERIDRWHLLLACGHTVAINPVANAATKQRELLASTMPCAICDSHEPLATQRRIASGLAEAELEERTMAKSERDQRAWNGDQIVRAKPEFL